MGIWPHAFCSKCSTLKGDLCLSDLALWAVEDNAMPGYCLHELQEVLVMLLRSMAINVYIIMNGNNDREMVHEHLKDILGHHQKAWTGTCTCHNAF